MLLTSFLLKLLLLTLLLLTFLLLKLLLLTFLSLTLLEGTRDRRAVEAVGLLVVIGVTVSCLTFRAGLDRLVSLRGTRSGVDSLCSRLREVGEGLLSVELRVAVATALREEGEGLCEQRVLLCLTLTDGSSSPSWKHDKVTKTRSS